MHTPISGTTIRAGQILSEANVGTGLHTNSESCWPIFRPQDLTVIHQADTDGDSSVKASDTLYPGTHPADGTGFRRSTFR